MKRLLSFAAAGLMALSIAAANPQLSAYAGSNGQHIELLDNLGYVYSACADGTNQNGVHSYTCWATPNYANPLYTFWWVGWVFIDEYGINGNYLRSVATYVPKSQSSDWWCFYDSNGSGYRC